ncbi:MAG: hypothetical protein ACOC5T_05495 [Elusimicrobiota bacterium]
MDVDKLFQKIASKPLFSKRNCIIAISILVVPLILLSMVPSYTRYLSDKASIATYLIFEPLYVRGIEVPNETYMDEYEYNRNRLDRYFKYYGWDDVIKNRKTWASLGVILVLLIQVFLIIVAACDRHNKEPDQ